MAAHSSSLHRAPSATERSFLLAAVGLGPGAPPFDDPALDWDFLLPYAKEHLVLPTLGAAATRDLPASRRNALVEPLIHNEMQNQLLLADLADAVAALDEAGIRSIALKGAGLMARFSDLVRKRQTDDIDLWVDPLRVFDADRILRARGYGDLAPSPVQPFLYDGRLSMPKNYPHQLPGLVSPRGTPLEIHRHPPNDDRACWDRAIREADHVVVRETAVPVRGDEAMLRDLCTHVVIHHGALPVLWPRHLLDVMALTEKSPDLMGRAARRARPIERIALLATARVLHEARESTGDPLARRLVFPGGGFLGWGWFRVLARLGEQARSGPAAMARALWPSEGFLRARGFDPDAGTLRARMAHAMDVLGRAGST